MIIYKYELPTVANGLRAAMLVSMPIGAKFLSLQMQNGIAVMWFQCNPQPGAYEDRMFFSLLTGQDAGIMQSDIQYLGTVQHDNGDFVVHWYERL